MHQQGINEGATRSSEKVVVGVLLLAYLFCADVLSGITEPLHDSKDQM
jgi:hypothetical protein